MTESVVAFALVAALVTITPGADTLLVLSSAVKRGFTHGVATAFGTVSGVYCWGIAAAAGASAVLAASETAYTALRIVGAAYLFWLGITALRSSLGTPTPSPDDELGAVPGTGGRLRTSYARGLLTNLLNPKIGVFYISFLPQFLPADTAALPAGALLTTVHVVEGLVFLSGVAALANRAGSWLRTPKVSRTLDRICAAVFIAFGLRLALSN